MSTEFNVEQERTFTGLVGPGCQRVLSSIYTSWRQRLKNPGACTGEDMISFLLAAIWSEDISLIRDTSLDFQTMIQLVEISDALVNG